MDGGTKLDRVEIARQIFDCYRRRLSAVDAHRSTGIPGKTIWRHYRVFELRDNGLGARAIQSRLTDWSLRQVEFVIHAIGAVEETEGGDAPRQQVRDGGYVARHRQQLAGEARRIKRWAERGISAHIRGPLRGSWPAPLQLERDPPFVPQLPVKPGSLLESLVVHLDAVALGETLVSLGFRWQEYRTVVTVVRDLVIKAQTFAGLDEEIEVGQIQAGLDILRIPGTERIPFAVSESEDGYMMGSAAYRQSFAEQPMAAQAAEWANRIPALVSGSSEGEAVIETHSRLKDRIERVAAILGDLDMVDRTISLSTCARCAPFPALDSFELENVV